MLDRTLDIEARLTRLLKLGLELLNFALQHSCRLLLGDLFGPLLFLQASVSLH